MKFIQNDKADLEDFSTGQSSCSTLPLSDLANVKCSSEICPNCGADLEGRKCKLFCTRRGCGYLVTCSEW